MENATIKDMSLNDEPKKENLDMNLESPSPVEIEARIKEAYPNQDIIKVNDKTSLMRMASGGYKFGDTSLEDCTPDDLNKIDTFLKSKGG